MQPLGDGALRFARPPGIGARELFERLRAWPGVTDAVVTPELACIYFDPAAPPEDPTRAMEAWANAAREARVTGPAPRLFTVKARYDGADLDEAAARLGLSTRDVVALHAGVTYTVAMVGFLPGFAYLGGGDPRLALPRRVPRARVPPGAIGVAAGYTGIYPFASPGGWNLVATAVGFEPFAARTGAALSLGDRVRFEPVP
jgi:UPF0271 protein